MENLMKSQYLVGGVVAVGAGAALTVFAPVVAAAVAGVGAIGAGAYWVSVCRHPGPLGLLPPTTADDGTRSPSRWYCDACGRSWPAGLESDHAPVVRFSGYDESKLPAAAKRAAAFEKQRTLLAAKRAGIAASRSEPAAIQPANVTSITDRRAG